MDDFPLHSIQLREDRFSRFEAIDWWSQDRLRDARILVAGAGALGNEVIKNLALLGVGHCVVVDMDRVEASNLSRSVLFRENDEKRSKAECAARGARDIFPPIRIHAIHGNLIADLGLGWFRWADVVIGALDNREARVFLNRCCAVVDRPWIDGGIGVLDGIVRGFAPPRTACYECTMSRTDWDILNRRYSCSLLGRLAALQQGTPTTPTTASVIGAIQVQEALKLLHGREALLGRGFFFEGSLHNSYTVDYPVRPDCGWHEPPPPVKPLPEADSTLSFREIVLRAGEDPDGIDAIDLSREILHELSCPDCGTREEVFQPPERIELGRLRCADCQSERMPTLVHSIPRNSNWLDWSPRLIGLPVWDVIWVRRRGETVGFELAGDRPPEAD